MQWVGNGVKEGKGNYLDFNKHRGMKIGIVEFIERYFEEHRKKFSQEEYFIEAMCKEMKREGLDIKVEVGLLGNQKGKELNGIRGANPKMIIEDEGEEESGGYRSCTFQEAMKLLGFRDRWQLDTILGKEIKRIGKRGVSVLLDREDVEGYRDGVRKVKEVKVERKKKKEVKMYVPKYKPTKDEMKGL